jgi:hypothetical protein
MIHDIHSHSNLYCTSTSGLVIRIESSLLVSCWLVGRENEFLNTYLYDLQIKRLSIANISICYIAIER